MKATVNNTDYSIIDKNREPLTLEVNGKSIVIDSFSPHKNNLNILFNSHSYNAELVSYNTEEKVAVVIVNNSRYEIKLKDETDELLEKLGIGIKQHKVQNIKAPMPGLVLEVKVKPGDTINKGDGILVLEAMKMENIIKAPAQAIVKKINVSKGMAVEKNQILIELE